MVGHHLIRTLALLAALGVLGACGFHPVNAPRSAGGSTLADMSMVKVGAVDEVEPNPVASSAHFNQLFRNRLLDDINPDGASAETRYELRVRLSQGYYEAGIQPDGSAARANVTVDAQYRLIALASGKAVLEGRSSSINGYSLITNSYATLVEGQDVRRRLVESVADDISRRVGLYFRSKDGED